MVINNACYVDDTRDNTDNEDDGDGGDRWIQTIIHRHDYSLQIFTANNLLPNLSSDKEIGKTVKDSINAHEEENNNNSNCTNRDNNNFSSNSLKRTIDLVDTNLPLLVNKRALRKTPINSSSRARQLIISTFGIDSMEREKMKVYSMDEVRCGDIQFEIGGGVKYFFYHQTTCQHHFIIDDVYLFNRRVEIASSFPRDSFVKKIRTRKCEVCLVLSAKLVVFGDRLMEDNPSFFCE
jgi:hypothetical protein